jgi:hypothetical protein
MMQHFSHYVHDPRSAMVFPLTRVFNQYTPASLRHATGVWRGVFKGHSALLKVWPILLRIRLFPTQYTALILLFNLSDVTGY